MELWDAYDENLNKIEGVTVVRDGERIPSGMFHLAVKIKVVHCDGSILVMQRDKRKSCGGLWEATAGGSVVQGETALQGAMRELFEETGLVVRDIVEVEKIIMRDCNTILFKYECKTDCDKNAIVLQEGETIAYKWVTEQEYNKMEEDGLIV